MRKPSPTGSRGGREDRKPVAPAPAKRTTEGTAKRTAEKTAKRTPPADAATDARRPRAAGARSQPQSGGGAPRPRQRYWLLKSEPESFSVDDLARAAGQTTFWNGVRNYQARNLPRDELRVGDGVLFYHSNANPPAVAGLAEVVQPGAPDATQFDPRSEGFDPGATREAPRWFGVEVKFRERFAAPVPLEALRATAGLEEMVLLARGSRLSVQPVTAEEWQIIVALGRKGTPREEHES